MDVLAQGFKDSDLVDLLEGLATYLVDRARATKDHHRGAVDRGRVGPSEQVERSRPGSRGAYPRLAGHTGVGMRREGGGLLVAKVDGLDAEILRRHHDIEVWTAHQVEEDRYALFLQGPGHQVASGYRAHGLLQVAKVEARLTQRPSRAVPCGARAKSCSHALDLPPHTRYRTSIRTARPPTWSDPSGRCLCAGWLH